MATFHTADLHLGHKNILHLGRGRPFSSIEEHDETIIERWNACVTDEDTVFLYGDAVMGPIAEGLIQAARLRGRKYLVSGNHDRTWAGFPGQTPGKMANWVQRYKDEGGFTAVNTWAHFIRSGIATPHVLRHAGTSAITVRTSHFPASATPYDDRYAAWRPKLKPSEWLIHGHIHDAWKVNGHQINIGVDVWGFQPVSERQILEVIGRGPHHASVREDVEPVALKDPRSTTFRA